MLENAVLAANETVFNVFLVDVFKDVRCVDKNAQCPTDGDSQEDVQL